MEKGSFFDERVRILIQPIGAIKWGGDQKRPSWAN